MATTDHRVREPSNWVADITFIKAPVYSDAVTDDKLNSLHTPVSATAAWPKVGDLAVLSPCPRVAITPIASPGHPADGQSGLFATQHLPPASFIIAYAGRVHTNAPDDTDPESDYDLSMDRELGLSVDAAKMGNEARFINDYRGIAPSPNAEFQDCWVRMPAGHNQGRRWERRIGVFVLTAGKAGKRARGIQPGQEILVNYGRSFWRERDGGVAQDHSLEVQESAAV